MSDKQTEKAVQEFVEVRKPGQDYEQFAEKKVTFDLPFDKNYKKYPRVDDNVTYAKTGRDYRGDMRESGLNLPDYSGPFRPDLSFMDFSHEGLIKLLWAAHDYYVLCVKAWAAAVAKRYGEDKKLEIQAAAWNGGVLPQLPRITQEFVAFEVTGKPKLDAGVCTFHPFKPDSRYTECGKERLVKMALGSHEFFLLVIESWAAQIVMRHGLDEMFSIQWDLWSAGGPCRNACHQD